MNWKRYVFIGVLVLGLFASIGRNVGDRKEVKSLVDQIAAVKARHDDSIVRLHGNIDRLQSKERFLVDSLDKINQSYSSLLTKTIALSKLDSLQKEEIRKGSLRYGDARAKQHQPVLASIYGNNAFDELGVLDKRIENQLKVESNYKGIVVHQDTIINDQSVTIKKLANKAKPNFWQRLKDWAIGIIIGGGGAFLLLL